MSQNGTEQTEAVGKDISLPIESKKIWGKRNFDVWFLKKINKVWLVWLQTTILLNRFKYVNSELVCDCDSAVTVEELAQDQTRPSDSCVA